MSKDEKGYIQENKGTINQKTLELLKDTLIL